MATEKPSMSYPPSRVSDHTDVLHGVSVPDPFRWLEEPDSEETKAWVKSQQAHTDEFLKGCPDISKLHSRYKEVFNYPKVGVPSRKGDTWFQFRNSGLENQYVLYKMKSLEEYDDAKVFINLNDEFPEGTTAFRATAASPDGKLYAYGLSESGSDWVTIKLRDVESGKALPDSIPWVKFSSISWTYDNAGFFYSRYPAPATAVASKLHGDAAGAGAGAGTAAAGAGSGDGDGDGKKSAGTETDANTHHMVYYHKLGTDAADDRCVYGEEVTNTVGSEVTEDGKFLLIHVSNGCDPVNKLYYVDLDSDGFRAWLAAESNDTAPPLRTVKLVDTFEAQYSYVANNDRKFWFVTNRDAPRSRIVSMVFPDKGSDTEMDPEALAAVPIVEELPEAATGAVLEWACCVGGDKVIVGYLHHVASLLEVRQLEDLTAPPHVVDLPAAGVIHSVSGRREFDEFLFKFTAFLHPGTVMRFDLATMTSSVFHQTTVAGFDPANYESEQVFATASDGTKLPLFFVRAKPDGEPKPAPCVMYVYGGFNISLQPGFSATRLVWLQEMGGVYAQACVRGGGEYGEEWHKAGALHNKPTCFDDVNKCAEHLIESGVTTSAQLGIMGGSNGGLVVLACAMQRPSLYRAVVSQVPVADYLRFHKFSIGSAWQTEYGDVDKEEDFLMMRKISPLHNVKAPASAEEELPAIVIATADHDDRVVPLHSFKMAAALQTVAGASPYQRNPLLIRIESKAGHGAGKPVSAVLSEIADHYGFFARMLGASFKSHE